MEEEKDQSSAKSNTAPFVVTLLEGSPTEGPGRALKAGDLCPKCHAGQLDYDGCLNLACPLCGYAVGGCFT